MNKMKDSTLWRYRQKKDETKEVNERIENENTLVYPMVDYALPAGKKDFGEVVQAWKEEKPDRKNYLSRNVEPFGKFKVGDRVWVQLEDGYALYEVEDEVKLSTEKAQNQKGIFFQVPVRKVDLDISDQDRKTLDKAFARGMNVQRILDDGLKNNSFENVESTESKEERQKNWDSYLPEGERDLDTFIHEGTQASQYDDKKMIDQVERERKELLDAENEEMARQQIENPGYTEEYQKEREASRGAGAKDEDQGDVPSYMPKSASVDESIHEGVQADQETSKDVKTGAVLKGREKKFDFSEYEDGTAEDWTDGNLKQAQKKVNTERTKEELRENWDSYLPEGEGDLDTFIHEGTQASQYDDKKMIDQVERERKELLDAENEEMARQQIENPGYTEEYQKEREASRGAGAKDEDQGDVPSYMPKSAGVDESIHEGIQDEQEGDNNVKTGAVMNKHKDKFDFSEYGEEKSKEKTLSLEETKRERLQEPKEEAKEEPQFGEMIIAVQPREELEKMEERALAVIETGTLAQETENPMMEMVYGMIRHQYFMGASTYLFWKMFWGL